MAELKPCPFCGGKAVLEHIYSGEGFSYIRCGVCGVKGLSFIKKFDRASDDEAIEAWNRRAEDGKAD